MLQSLRDNNRTKANLVRNIDFAKFPDASTIAAGIVEVEPGGLREMHWHPHFQEWQHYLLGTRRMTVFDSEYNARTFDFSARNVAALPTAYAHYIGNTSSDQQLLFMEVFRSAHFQDLSLNQWMALTPPELVKQHLKLSNKAMDSLRKEKWQVVKNLNE